VRSHPDVARFLLSRGARSDILLASALGDLEQVRRLLDTDPASVQTAITEQFFPKQNPHAGGHIYGWSLGHGKTAHIIAREFGQEKVFELLMSRTPEALKLVLACELGDVPAFRALLRSRPDLAQGLNDDDRRRLPAAAQHNNVEAVRLMLEAGWPVDAVGQHGATALHWAGFHGNPAMARAILPHHPPLEAREKDYGQTALQWTIYGSANGWYAETGDYVGVLELLLAAGAIAPPVTPKTQGSDVVLAALRRHASS
jgi:hypothetical protein